MANGVDLAQVIERLVPQAAFGTAHQTDIDADDYAALRRTWFDQRPLPPRQRIEQERAVLEAELAANEQDRQTRRERVILLRNQAELPTTGEIGSITSIADAKQVMLKMQRFLAYVGAVVDVLQHDRGLIE